MIQYRGNEECFRLDTCSREECAHICSYTRAMRAPKLIECPVKQRNLIVIVHKQTTGRMIEVIALPNPDVMQSFDAVNHPPRRNLDARAAQQAPEKHQVMK